MSAPIKPATGWSDPVAPQGAIIEAAEGGDTAGVFNGFLAMFENRLSDSQIKSVLSPIQSLTETRRFTGGRLYETRRFEDELAEFLMVLDLSDGTRIYSVITFAHISGAWLFKYIVYNTDWDEIAPKLPHVSGTVPKISR